MQIYQVGNGDGLRAYANVSQGSYWAAMYAVNTGSSPGVYADSDGQYAGYFVDDIYVGGSCVGCTLVYLAENTGTIALEPGDLAVVNGMGEALQGTGSPVIEVSRAGAGGALIGVMHSKAVITTSNKDGIPLQSAERAEGAAAPGEYLFIVVQGIAYVKGDATSQPIFAGERLPTDSQGGYARAVLTTNVNGIEVAESAAVVGIALASLERGQGLIPVMVTLR